MKKKAPAPKKKPTKKQLPAVPRLTKKQAAIERDEKAITVVSERLAMRVLDIVDQGLCSGMGKPIPGQMCVEAAVCYAMGMEHDDEPTCVDEDVRDAKIALNDMKWPSREERAKGMRRIAVAQLGSDEINGFREFLQEAVINNIAIPALKQKGAEDEKLMMLIGKLEKAKGISKKCQVLEKISELDNKKVSSLMYEIDLITDEFFNCKSIVNYAKKLSISDNLTTLNTLALCIEQALVRSKSKGAKWLHLTE